MRRLLKSESINELYRLLKKDINPADLFDFKTIKEILYQNDPHKTIYVLKQLYLNKVATGEKFSSNYQDIIDKIVFHLSAEIAFVTKKSIESVQKKIYSLL